MKKLYLDFDNTMVNSNKRVIEILNQRYGLNKEEKDLKDYDFRSIYQDITIEEKLEIFEDDAFFDGLEIKDDCLETLKIISHFYDIVIVSIGTEENLRKKELFLAMNMPVAFDFIGIKQGKTNVDMKDGIQIDDCLFNLNTNAHGKVLLKSEYSFPWQSHYENLDVLVAYNWEQIRDILMFFANYNYYTLELEE